MGRYEFKEGASAKFWEHDVDGSRLIVRYGRLGTQGQTKEKTFANPEAARKEEAKLVKEKVGKGYVKSGETNSAAAPAPAAAPKADVPKAEKKRAAKPRAVDEPADEPDVGQAPEPAVSSAAAPSEEEGGKLFSARALPTRTRPEPAPSSGETSTPDEIWARFRQTAQSLGAEVSETPPAITSVNEVVQWGAALHNWDALHGPGGRNCSGDPKHVARKSAAALLMEWLIASHGALLAVQAASRFLAANSNRSSYSASAWSDVLSLALRAALTRAPETGYDEALAWCLAECEAQPDWRRSAYFAFIFADDRSKQHALQPLEVLKAAAAQGVDVTNELQLFPLIVDAPPSEVAAWRTRKSYFFYFFYSDVSADEASATLMAVANASGEHATPLLGWLLYYGVDQARTQIASAILETREDAALAELLPFLHEKWIRQALDLGAAAYPAFIFRQCLAVSASGRVEPAIRARVADLIARHGQETAREWANGLGAKAVKHLEALIGDSDALASAEALPAMFRDPPWRRTKGKVADDIVLAVQPIATPFAFPPAKNKAAYPQRQNRELPVKDMTGLAAFLIEAEAAPRPSWGKKPAAPERAPSKAMSPDEALAWLTQRLVVLNRASHGQVRWSNYGQLYETLERLPEPLALALWELTGPALNAGVYWDYVGPAMLLRFGERALPGLLKLIESDPVLALEFAAQVDAPGIAPFAARALLAPEEGAGAGDRMAARPSAHGHDAPDPRRRGRPRRGARRRRERPALVRQRRPRGRKRACGAGCRIREVRAACS